MLWVSTVPGRIIITQSLARARGMAGGYTHVVQIVWGPQLKYLCVIRRTALSRCLSPRFKCPVMKSTEPPAPGIRISLFSTWSPLTHRISSCPNRFASELSLKYKAVWVWISFQFQSVPLVAATCAGCNMLPTGEATCNTRATGFRATWAADWDFINILSSSPLSKKFHKMKNHFVPTTHVLISISIPFLISSL